MFDFKIVGMFYFIGFKYIIFNCLIDLMFDFNLFSGVQSYENSDIYCLRNVIYNIFFFLENLGLRFFEWSVNVYELRFGYYIQV